MIVLFDLVFILLFIVSIIVMAISINISTLWIVLFVISLVYLLIRGLIIFGFDLDFWFLIEGWDGFCENYNNYSLFVRIA